MSTPPYLGAHGRKLPMTNQRENNLVPILPASEGESSSQGFDNSTTNHNSNSSNTPDPVVHLRDLPKRTSVRVACHACRRKRIRCGGQRPSCWQCHQKDETCVYEAEEGETVSLALRRKLSELESENDQYKELYGLLRDTPNAESSEILRRIQTSDNPLDVLSFIRQARLLLPSFNSGSSSVQESSSGRENHGSSSDLENHHPSLSSGNNLPSSSGLESHPSVSSKGKHPSSSGLETHASASSRGNHPSSSDLDDYFISGRETQPSSGDLESTP